MKKYFVAEGESQVGPFNLEELKSKNITSDSMIWFEGAKEWIKAGEVQELKELIRAIPPPLNSKAEKKSKKRSFLKPFLIFFGVGVSLWIAGTLLVQSGFSRGASISENAGYSQKVLTVQQVERQNPTRFLKATGTYRENLLGDKLKVNVEIRNVATATTFKDAVVRVKYYSKSKTNLGSKDYTIYEVFPPNSKKSVNLKIENYKNVKSIGWDVVSARPFN